LLIDEQVIVDEKVRERIAYYLKSDPNIEYPDIHSIEPNIELGHTQDYVIRVNPAFFSPKEINVSKLGRVTILTKYGQRSDPAFETDFSGPRNEVYINFFNDDVRSYHVSVYEVETMLKMAAAETSDKDDFLEEALRRLRGQHLRKGKKAEVIRAFLNLGAH
jgi:hypothetical protein